MTQDFLLESYLKQLRLPGMLHAYQSGASEAARANLTYEHFLPGLLREEIKNREASRIQRAIAAARFPVLKELAEFEWSYVPSVPKARILELAQGAYIENHEPIVLIGNPGLGKSHVASGLALAACRQGRKVRFYNVAGLINELIKAQQEYQLSRVMATLCKQELIVLDELGFLPLTREGAQLLFQVCSALYERVAVIVTTNLRFAEWSSLMGGEERMSAALLDRLTHRATILEFVGTSYRFRQQLQKTPHLQEEQEGSAHPEEKALQEGKEETDGSE